MTAMLYGVGVGPGDPELLTLKAARLLAESDVAFCPRGAGGRPGRARTAAAAHLRGKRVVELEMEMRGDREQAIDHAAAIVVAELGEGLGVYLTEGDPSLYSTFQLLRRALLRQAPGLRVEVVPGVSSVTAAAAAAGVALGMGEETLAIVPASAPMPLLEDVLATFDQTVLLKPSIRAGELGTRLTELGLLGRSVLVSEASGEREQVRRGDEAAATPPPYFSTWLIPGGPPDGAPGRVHFLGAGPGAASLLTRRALSLLRWADLVVAADSLVAPEVIELARPSATLLRSSALTLEETVPAMLDAARAGKVVVRLHSGDPSLYGAIVEQMARLREAGCPYEVVAGVSSAGAVAAALGVELTEPGGAQTVVFTRHGRRVPAPASERLRDLAAHRATLAIFLSAAAAREVQSELLEGGLSPDTPAVIAYRVSWPDELVVRTVVGQLAHEVRRLGLRRHTLILVGDALRPGTRRSRLYDSGHTHVYRRRGRTSAPALPAPPALVALTEPGARLARRLGRSTAAARVLVPDHLSGGGEEALGTPSERLPELFAGGTPLVLFMAVGAAVRLLGPALRDKRREPPVVVVDDAGRYAVSLLGGRAAGANRLAEWVAAVLGAEAVVTTAAERLGLPALDELIAVLGWRPAGGARLAPVEAAVVSREPIGFFGPGIEAPPGIDVCRVASVAEARELRAGLAVTDQVIDGLPAGWALVHPRRLRMGVGCSTGATAGEAVEAALAALTEAGLSPAGVSLVATIDRRGEHPALVAVAERLQCQLVTFTSDELARVAVPNGSEAVREAVGTPSVAEAAALAGAAGGRLLLPKLIRGQITIAIAEAAFPPSPTLPLEGGGSSAGEAE